jgi:methionyl-tRNA formyltransferase
VRLVFCGTPAFAVPTFRALLSAGHSIELTLCQPDRPSGRGLTVTAPPVKRAALEAGIDVLQPEKVRNNVELQSRLKSIQPDAIVVVAYGRIIPRWMLDLPRHGNLNLHGSLLPKYRGAAPIQWAVANGETVTGLTTMLLNEGMDTGDILMRREVGIAETDTAEDLFPRMAEIGALLTRDDGRVDTARPTRSIYDRWRGFQPWPGAWTMVRGKKLTLQRLTIASSDRAGEPGVFRVAGDRLFFSAGDGGVLEVLELQMEGKRRMPAADLLRGHGIVDGDRLNS